MAIRPYRVLIMTMWFINLKSAVGLRPGIPGVPLGAKFSTVLKSRKPDANKLANKELKQELEVIYGLAKSWAEQAEILRQ